MPAKQRRLPMPDPISHAGRKAEEYAFLCEEMEELKDKIEKKHDEALLALKAEGKTALIVDAGSNRYKIQIDVKERKEKVKIKKISVAVKSKD
jgi:hypothetical protein